MEHKMKMQLLIQNVFFSLWIVTYNLPVTESELRNKTYINKLEFKDKVCPAADTISIGTVASKIACGIMCFERPDCKGFSYSSIDLACTGCKKLYLSPSQLDELSGSIFFTSAATACAEPVIGDPHVNLRTFDKISQIGDEVNYTCNPCTFFPLDEPAVITCQLDGTWSAPTCVFGPDVGRLSNGQQIPPGSTGCASISNSSCQKSETYHGEDSALTYQGLSTGGCYCDDQCCDIKDCCFDYSCPNINED